MPNQDFIDLEMYQTVFEDDSLNGADMWLQEKEIIGAANLNDDDKKRKERERINRFGIPHTIRSIVWANLIASDEREDYSQVLHRVFGKKNSVHIRPPTFHGINVQSKLMLNSRGKRAVERVLCIIAHDFPQLEFCPMLPSIACILSHYLLEEQLYNGMLHLIKNSISNRWSYFPTHKNDYRLFLKLFVEKMKKKYPVVFKAVSGIKNHRGKPIWDMWFRSMFISYFPTSLVFRLMDSFLVEGCKAVYRFAMAALLYYKSVLPSLDNFDEMAKLYNGNIANPSDFMELAFSIRLEPNLVSALSNMSPSSLDLDDSDGDGSIQHIYIRPKLDLSEQSIKKLTSEEWNEIWSWLPSRYRSHEMYTLFSTREDGYRLMTLIEQTMNKEPLLILFETNRGEIFGSFISSRLFLEEQDIRYYGTGETFVFSLRPHMKQFPWVGKREELSPEVAYRIEMECSLFYSCSNKELIIGGGGGTAIMVDANFKSGTSQPCLTFENPSFTNMEGFDCVMVEAYGFRSP